MGQQKRFHVVFVAATDQRDADITTREDFSGEFPDRSGELHREKALGDLLHRSTHSANEPLHVLGCLACHHLGDGPGDSGRDGVGDVLPHGKSDSGPFSAGAHHRSLRKVGDGGHLGEPQACHRRGLAQGLAGCRVQRERTLTGDRDGVIPRGLRFEPAAGSKGGTELHHHLLQFFGRDVDSRGFHEFFRVEGLIATKKLSEGVLHPLFITKAWVVARVLGHDTTVQG